MPTTASGWRQIELAFFDRLNFFRIVDIKQNLSSVDQ